MRKIGLTGSIGMGKSTTADFFRAEGIPVHDSDACVHRLYQGAVAELISSSDPSLVTNGSVDRAKLSERIARDPVFLEWLESIVHPRVSEDRDRFIERAARAGNDLVVLDVPLLFETGLSQDVDLILVITADEKIQRERVLRRPGMTVEKFELLLSKQISSELKKSSAHFVIDTSHGLEKTKADVKALIRAMRT